jgi:hypothetical protein
MSLDTFGSRSNLDVAGRAFVIHRLAALQARHPAVARDRVHARARAPAGLHRRARVVDLAAMREAIASSAATRTASTRSSRSSWSSTTRCRSTSTAARRSGRTPPRVRAQRERYQFLRWGQKAVRQLQGRAARHRHRAPGQPRVPGARRHGRRRRRAYPDTLVGTDSHTTMINGLGVLGWGVGGIEAEAAMLGQPCRCSSRRWSASASRASCPKAPRRPTWC